jgi:flagellin
MFMSNTIIATNVMALNSHRALTGVGGSLAKSSEKLSSGHRINRAADDAAGLAISEKMRSQIRGLDQATKNSQDGISLIQTAEGALQETENMLQKMRELTVQAANDTNTASDRDKIAGEIDEIIAEIDSTADKTEFNTKKLINGDWKNQSLYLQTGANSGQGMEFNIQQMDAITLGTTQGTISSVIRGNGVDGDEAIQKMTADKGSAVILGDKELAGVFTFSGGASVEVLENGDLKVSGMKNGVDDAEKTYSLADIKTAGITLTDKDGGTFTVAAGGGVTVTGAPGEVAGTKAAADIETAIGGTAAGDSGTLNAGSVEMKFTNVKGTDDWVDNFGAGDESSTITFDKIDGATFMDADGKKVDIEAGKAYKAADIATVAYIVDKNGNKFDFDPATGLAGTTGTGASVKSVGFIASSDEAKKVVEDQAVTGQASGKVISGLTETIDGAIEEINKQRAKLGAYQNRLDYTINNLQTSSENLSASESRIRDTDMAKEMMNMTKSNVLQQAATSMLAQANQAPQNILKLLG